MPIEVFIDGLCEPMNPHGTAAYGIVIYRDGVQIKTLKGIVGSGTGMSNNVAEYSGLVELIKYFRE